MPPAQRVLISDVPAQAVFALLRYLYTAHCSLPASLQPHVLELAQRYQEMEDVESKAQNTKQKFMRAAVA